MMKQPTGKLVASFNFTDIQRQKLMRVWPRATDRQKAEKFINHVENIVEIWLPGAQEPKATIPEMRNYAASIHKAAIALQSALDAPPENVAFHLKAHVDGWLNGFHRHEHEEVTNDLRCLFPDIPRPGLFEMAEVLDSWLDLLRKFSEKLSVMNGISGNDKSAEKQLIFMLAGTYEQDFGKPPKASNGSNFRKFSSELSGILGWELGANIVSEILEKRNASLQKLNKT